MREFYFSEIMQTKKRRCVQSHHLPCSLTKSAVHAIVYPEASPPLKTHYKVSGEELQDAAELQVSVLGTEEKRRVAECT